MTSPVPHWPLPWFATPATPDLGCFVQRRHGFEVDSTFGLWMEFPPWENTGSGPRYIPHQLYYRIKCGEAAFHERVRNWMVPVGTPPPLVLGTQPDGGVGGDFRPMPSDWVKLPVQSGPKDYWFLGEYRNPAGGTWQRDALVGHSFDLYENGTLSTVEWDDTGGDMDHNDLIMEVAVVFRRSYFDWLHPVVATQAELDQFVERDFAKLQGSERVPPGNRGTSAKS